MRLWYAHIRICQAPIAAEKKPLEDMVMTPDHYPLASPSQRARSMGFALHEEPEDATAMRIRLDLRTLNAQSH